MADRRERFERRDTERRITKMREDKLSESLDALMDAASGLDGVNYLDEIVDGLESIESQVSKAKRQAERLMDGER